MVNDLKRPVSGLLFTRVNSDSLSLYLTSQQPSTLANRHVPVNARSKMPPFGIENAFTDRIEGGNSAAIVRASRRGAAVERGELQPTNHDLCRAA